MTKHTLPTTLPPVTSQTKEVTWRDMHGRDLKPRDLEDSHLANIIHHIMQKPGYSKEMFEAMVREADIRGLSQEYIEGAPYPFVDPGTGVTMIAEYDNGTFSTKIYEEEDNFVLRVGAKVIGITLDPAVFGDPVLKDDLPITTKEAKYTRADVIPWTHDVGNSIMTYWMISKPPTGASVTGSMESRKKNYVLLKVSQKNKFGVTHLIVCDDDLPLYDPEAV